MEKHMEDRFEKNISDMEPAAETEQDSDCLMLMEQKENHPAAEVSDEKSDGKPGYEELLKRIHQVKHTSEKTSGSWKQCADEIYHADMPEAADADSGHGTKKGRFGLGFMSGFMSALVCVAVCGIGWMLAENGILQKEKNKEINEGAAVLTSSDTLYRLAEVQELIENYALEDVDSDHLSSYLFKGLAVGMDDPYAGYYTAEELQSLMDSSIGEYHGIGATLSEELVTGEISVIQVYDGSPAEEGGLKQGDVLQYVEDKAVTGMDLTELVTLIKGMEDEFLVGVYRPELDEIIELTLWCGEVELDHVEEKMLEDGIGYIQLLEFSQSAVDQFETALEVLNAQGMEMLIVDLRNNPGGLLTSVCDILGLVQPEGLIVYTEDKNGTREEYSSEKGDRRLDCPVAVLVNEYSASASEIFAGSIQDYELGPVVGTQTYGKGVVQKTYPLKDGGAFKMTVEKYFTAGGQDIDGNGIIPDIVVEETSAEDAADMEQAEDAVLQAAVEALKQQEKSN